MDLCYFSSTSQCRSPQKSDDRNPRKLGLLGGIFEDGSFSIFVVPDVDDVKARQHNCSNPIYGERIVSLVASFEF